MPLEDTVSALTVSRNSNEKLHDLHTHTHTHTHIYIYIYLCVCVGAVQKESEQFEYLENRLRGLDVTWQPVRGDRTVHP